MIVWSLLPPQGEKPLTREAPTAVPLEGLTFSEAFQTRHFWMLSTISVLCVFGVGGFTSHLVPYVRDNGFSAQHAAGLASLVAAASIAGRLLTGVLLDRFRGPGIGSLLIGLGMAGLLLVALEGPALATFSVALLGFAIGSEVDLIAYFASRYFGLRAHGAIFGWNYAMVALGGGSAPVAVGLLRDLMGGYALALWLLCAALFVAAALCLLLGPYRYTAHPLEGDSKTY